jgi:hypothetical protein
MEIKPPVLLKKVEDALLIDEVWQVAFEMGYQHSLAQKTYPSREKNSIARG